MNKATLILMVIVVNGCAAMEINPAISGFREKSSQIQLGDSKDKVL